VETLLQEILAQRLLVSNGLTLTEADIMAEWQWKKNEFENDLLHQGIPYEDIVRQQTGLDAEAFRKTRGFRVNAAVGRLAMALFTDTQVREAFEAHQNLYGPRYTVRHVLLRASDHLNLKGKVRTIAEGRELAAFVAGKAREGIPFQDLVRQYSEDQATKFKDGVLPPFTPGRNTFRFDERAFVEACLKLEPYEISEPVQTGSGWHVIRVDRKDPVPELDAIRADLRRVMAAETFREAFQKAKIGVDVRL
jgi:parvulin-like peptidyl-prolyl isomerase